MGVEATWAGALVGYGLPAMGWDLLRIAAGLGVLVLAADRLVIAAVRLARAWGVSAILVGALVVGLGTSMPEMLVSGIAALDGQLDVAVANVVGSNVANMTLVLGVTAIIAPLIARLEILKREGILMIVALAVLAVFLFDHEFARWEAGLLAFGMVVALYLLLRWSWRDAEAESAVEAEIEEMSGGEHSWPRELAIGIVALAATIYAADLTLDGALGVGEELGLSATFLGLMLGVGTSMPELATAVASVRRNEGDLVVGNVLGSNLFNSLAVAGIAGLVGPGSIDPSFRGGALLMLAVAVVAGFFSRSGNALVRSEGVVLVAGFGAFTLFLI
ncbi:MAG: calcium/sodium antiporter [Acidimicrobiia bacterium]|nr:calcium/sodium antiporter [Acidimicrobiia bacterium]